MFAAPPCSSFSVAHTPRLRTRSEPEGTQPVPPEWAQYLRRHNTLADVTARLVRAADAAGCAWMVENPADCGDPGSVAYWPRFSSHAPLWCYPRIREALEAGRAHFLTCAQCALGAPTRKYTTLAFSPPMEAHVRRLRAARCTHGTSGHAE
eukprot:891245-Pleurochrysis_carterae.AAC.1